MTSESTTARPFRNDINGLRAWAVVSVVLFHFGVAGFQGGFIGVDVFFVISGFLMTSIIVEGLASDRFSIASFYRARARRIVPALGVLCCALLALGWFWLPSPDYRAFALDAFLALVFLSNVKFWREAGYFDADSHEKLLLHTWSLSVEWQFYLLLPLALVVVWRLGGRRRGLLACYALLGLASLALSWYLTAKSASSAFFLLPTRVWEMIAGGLVFFLKERGPASPGGQRALEWTGLAMIVAALAAFDGSTPWPSVHALLPVAGAAFVLLAQRRGSFATGSTVAQWIGLRSYSIYLWHWPVVVILGFAGLSRSVVALGAGMALSLVLGSLSYRYVEKTSANALSHRAGARPARFFRPAAWACLCIPCVVVVAAGGVPGRLPAGIERVSRAAEDKNPRMAECHAAPPARVPGCTYGGPKLGAIVMGDSHAATLVRAVEHALPGKDLHVLDWTYSGCRTLLNSRRIGEEKDACSQFVRWALEAQKQFPADVPLVIANRISVDAYGQNEGDQVTTTSKPQVYFDKPFETRNEDYRRQLADALVATACEFRKYRRVYMVRPFPEMRRNVPRTMARAMILGRHEEVDITLDEYRARQAYAWQLQNRAHAQCGVEIIDPTAVLCDARHCHGAHEGMPNYFDDDHLGEHGAGRLVPMIRAIFGPPGVPQRQTWAQAIGGGSP
ncbi:acyltransferase family protein [Xenophilus azovorans]|uniref:acyltransferase family protein n=1 Tax=Xenophilus azovorans TaxID=151755 RepID=UPI00068C6FF0|nr:acyltransferase family protein [Xenophilus azovorans]